MPKHTHTPACYRLYAYDPEDLAAPLGYRDDTEDLAHIVDKHGDSVPLCGRILDAPGKASRRTGHLSDDYHDACMDALHVRALIENDRRDRAAWMIANADTIRKEKRERKNLRKEWRRFKHLERQMELDMAPLGLNSKHEYKNGKYAWQWYASMSGKDAVEVCWVRANWKPNRKDRQRATEVMDRIRAHLSTVGWDVSESKVDGIIFNVKAVRTAALTVD
jgi:hypothetical protein